MKLKHKFFYFICILFFINKLFAQDNSQQINQIDLQRLIYEQPDSAYDLVKKKESEYLKTKNWEQYFSILSLKGMVEISFKRYNTAILILNRCDSFYRIKNDSIYLSSIYNTFGRVFEEMGDLNLEVTYLTKSLNYCNQMKFPENKFLISSNLGFLYVQKKSIDSATYFFEQAKKLLPQLKDPQFEFILKESYASLLFLKKQYNQSLSYILEVLEVNKHSLSVSTIANLILAADNFIELKNYPKASKYLDSALKISKQLGIIKNELEVYKRQILIDTSTNNWDKAFKTNFKYQQLKDSIFSEENNLKSKELILKYQTEVSDKQNLLLQKEKKVISNYLIFSIVSLLLLTSVIFLMYRNNKKVKQFSTFKDSIITIISHDLRSPLIALQDLNSLLSLYLRKNDFGKIEQLANDIDIASCNINNQSTNLLIWAKGNNNQQLIFKKQNDVVTIIDSVLNLYSQILDSKSIKVSKHTNRVVQELQTSEFVLELILRNWIDNVVKHSKPKNIDIELQNAFPQITIKDDGNLSIEEQQNIIEHFRNTNNLQFRIERGLGLGLMAFYANKIGYNINLAKDNSTNVFTIGWKQNG